MQPVQTQLAVSCVPVAKDLLEMEHIALVCIYMYTDIILYTDNSSSGCSTLFSMLSLLQM